MDTAFLKANTFNRTIYLHEVATLGEQDMSLLAAELEIGIESMQVKMHQQRGIASNDWLYSVNLKIKVCQQFLGLISESRQNLFNYFYEAVGRAFGRTAASNCLKVARQQAQAQKQTLKGSAS